MTRFVIDYGRLTPNVIFGMVLAVGYILFLVTLPPARVIVSLSAHSEFVSYTVSRPNSAILRVRGMDLKSADLVERCVDATVSPPQDAKVEYRRGGSSYFRIILTPRDGNVVVKSEGKPERRFSGATIFDVGDCQGSRPASYPVWGPAQFGDAIRDAGDEPGTPGLLLDGSISVTARAHDKLLGIPFPPLIYKVNAFELPPGAVLTNAPQVNDVNEAWVGAVRIDGDHPGFQVLAASSAGRIVFKPPGLPTSSRGNGLVDLGSYPQFLSDPNIVVVQYFFGLFLLLVHTVRSFDAIYATVRTRLRGEDAQDAR